VLETIDRITISRQKRVKTPELNKFVAEITGRAPPASPGRVHAACCMRRRPAWRRRRSSSSTTSRAKFHFSYERFLVNQLRDRFGFEGTPIQFHVRTRSSPGFGRFRTFKRFANH